MKIVTINTYNNYSTGNIALSISDFVSSKGENNPFLYGRCKNNGKGIYIGTNKILNKLSNFLVDATGLIGHFHFVETNHIIKYLKRFKPDIIHLHNIHGNYLNFPILMKYIIKNNIKLVITAHDFWYGTGKCCHCLSCKRYQNQCGHCPQLRKYPISLLFDRTKNLLKEKVFYFSKIQPTIICPSKWLANLYVSSNIGKCCDVKIVNNGIDFKGIQNSSCNDGIVHIIGVAYPWSETKGLNVFNKLASDLDSNKFDITLVGLRSNDKTHPLIKRYGLIKDKFFLQKLYSNSTIFVNPSIADTYPTTNIEALRCGIPVIAYEVTGTSEIINDISGFKIKNGEYKELLKVIKEEKYLNLDKRKIIDYSYKFNKENMNKKYYNIYVDIFKKEKIDV